MPRKNLTLSDTFPYHVTNRSNNRDWFYIPMESAWRIFCHVLSTASTSYQAEIHTFVLMSNHYHLLLSTPKTNLDCFMRYFQTEACRQVQKQAVRINHVFGGRYRWSLLGSSAAIAYTYKYVCRNPVRAGMVERVEQYPFSSVQVLLQLSNQIPLVDRIDPLWNLVPRNSEERLAWLNRETPKKAELLVGKALRRYHFQFSRGNEVRSDLEILKDSYGVDATPATHSSEKWDRHSLSSMIGTVPLESTGQVESK